LCFASLTLQVIANVQHSSINNIQGAPKKYPNTKMLISHKMREYFNTKLSSFTQHIYSQLMFFIYLLNTLLSSEETKSMFNFRYSTSAQHDQQRMYPRR